MSCTTVVRRMPDHCSCRIDPSVGASAARRSHSLVAVAVSPATLERDLVGDDPEHRHLHVGRAKPSLDVDAAGKTSATATRGDRSSGPSRNGADEKQCG
jgi:hypothetical protein